MKFFQIRMFATTAVRAMVFMTATGALFLADGIALAAREPSFRGEGEYVVPVSNASLKPFSKFVLNEVTVSKNADGLFVMVIELPYDLTGGEKIRIDLVENFADDQKIILVNPDGNGFAECKGATWATSTCRYEFEGLKAKFAAKLSDGSLSGYVRSKYRGDPALAKREAVTIQFGTEAIGEMILQKLDAACAGCSLGNGEWESEYTTRTGDLIAAPLSLARRVGTYFNDTGSGTFSDIVYQGHVATGRWKYSTSTGWFRFEFDAQGQNFTGNWGVGNAGSPAVGTWTGFRP
jgi:hypothetical protein